MEIDPSFVWICHVMGVVYLFLYRNIVRKMEHLRSCVRYSATLFIFIYKIVVL